MKFRPYISFNGNCQEAAETYANAFNTELGQIMRFGDIPADPGVPALTQDQKKWILQTTIAVGDEFIRLSDSLHQNPSENSMVSIAVEAPVDGIRHAFEILSADGTVLAPLSQTFFSPCYGSLIDRFGVKWELTAL